MGYFYKLYILLTIPIFFFACTDSEEELKNIDNTPLPIKFYASIGSPYMTESTRLDHQDTLIYNGELAYIWVDKVSSPSNTPFYGAWSHLSDGNGALNPVIYGTRFYPPGNSPISIYAAHGNFTPSITENSPKPDTLKHSVLTDQTIDSNYLLSDFLYTKKPTQTAATRVQLLFMHMLCKIEVCFKPFGVFTDDSLINARASLVNVMKNSKLSLDGLSGETYGEYTTIEIPFTCISQSATDFSGATYGEAIIPPQLIKNVFMKLTLQSGTTLYYVPPEPYVLESGKLYRFNMCVKHVIKLGGDTPNVNPWDHDDIIESYFIEPERIMPIVTDWNYDNYYRNWSWITPPPNVEVWNNHDKPSIWSWMIVPPYVEEWGDNTKETSWSWVILPPLVNNWTKDSVDTNIGNIVGKPFVNGWNQDDYNKPLQQTM